MRASVAGTSTGDLLNEIPSADAFFWYLVRGWNGTGEGPAGMATAGPRLQETGGACP